MTRLLVLGLLDERPMSGYDIQQTVSRADAERWGGVLVGSIYHALKRLEQERYIALAGVERTGYRRKSVYGITDRGRAYLRSLILDSLRASPAVYPTTLYSGLSLLDKVPREAARQALEEQKKLLEEEYDALERGRRSNEEGGQEVSQISNITIGHMFSVIRLQQKFVEEILGLV